MQESSKVLYPRSQPPSSFFILDFLFFFLSRLDILSLWVHTAMLGSCQWAVCPQQGNTRVHPDVKSSNRHHCTKWLPLARAQEAGDSSRERWSDSLNFSVPILLAISSVFPQFSTALSHQLNLSLPLPWSLLPNVLLPAPKKRLHHL